MTSAHEAPPPVHGVGRTRRTRPSRRFLEALDALNTPEAAAVSDPVGLTATAGPAGPALQVHAATARPARLERDEAELLETARLLARGLRPLRRARPVFRTHLGLRLEAQRAARPRSWWGWLQTVVVAWCAPLLPPEGRPARLVASGLLVGLLLLVATTGAALPAWAGQVGGVLGRLRVPEVQQPPPRPPITHDPSGVLREVPIPTAAALVSFPLLVPTDLPPGYEADGGVAQLGAGNPAHVTLVYVGAGAEAKRWPAIHIAQHRLQDLPEGAPLAAVRAGTAETVRIGEVEGLYLLGAWAYRSGIAVAEYTPALHSIVFDRDGIRVELRAAQGDVSKEQLLRVATSLAPVAGSRSQPAPSAGSATPAATSGRQDEGAP